jgi:outer membrane autotransporter protein
VQVAALDPVAAPLGQADRAVTWGRVVGSRSELEDSGDLPGVESRLAGFHLGAEAPLGGGFLFGVALGFERGTLDAGSLASSDLDAYSAGLYARQRWAAFRLSAGASYTHLSLDGSRSVTGFGAQTADYAAGVWGAEAEAAYDLAVSRTTTLTPLAGVRLARSSRDGYAESGIAGLEVADSSQESLRGRLGAELTLRELADPDASAEASLLGGPSFTIEGQRLPDDVAEIGASLAWSPRTDLALFATYDGAFSGGYASHAGGIGIRFAW